MNYFKSRLLPTPTSERKGWPWNNETPENNHQSFNCIDRPKVSVITPSYNQGPFIEETIRSVLLQEYPNIEYIVVDGGSKDETIEILKKYKNFITFISEPDNGQTDAINKGVKLSTGDILAYLNSDDIYMPGAIQKVVDCFSENHDIVMVYGNIIHIDQESRFIGKYRTGQINLKKFLLENIYLPQPTVFFRREIISEIGYFDDKLHLAMDVDYWIRIMNRFSISYIDDFLAAARIYPEAKSTKYDTLYLYDFLRIYTKSFEEEQSLNVNDTLKRRFLSRIYLNAACTSFGRLSIKESREYFKIGFKYNPANIFKFYYFIRFLGALGGKIPAKIFLNFKRKSIPNKY